MDLERVRARREAGVALGGRTGGKDSPVDLALEGPSRFAAEGERGGGGVRRVGRIRSDARRSRRGRVDRPCIAGGRPRVSGRVRLTYLERVRACRKAAVALRTGARGEPCAVELASKGSSRFTAE